MWYLRDLEGEKNEAFNKDESYDIEEEKTVISSERENIHVSKPSVQETPFLRGKSFSFHIRSRGVDEGHIKPVVKQESSVQLSSPSPLPTSGSPPCCILQMFHRQHCHQRKL